ncbi:fumarate reductase/succinate dehydrogenase flavoprotein domain-containing protein, partial [Corynascus similis CBS 632.67]
IQVQPGDAGTKGGLLTDEFSRVLRSDGSFIRGVYAAEDSAASIMGSTSLGAGVTIGPAITFAYIAVQDI